MQPGYGYPNQPYPGQQPYPAGYGYPPAGPPPGPGFAAAPPFGSAPYSPDNEAGEFEDNMQAFGSKEVRMGFIRKVYSILSVQLIVTFGFVCIFVYSDGAKKFARENSAMVFVGFGVSIVSLLVLMCCGEVRRKFPANFICLGIFTLAQSFMLGVVSGHYGTKIVMLAVLITAVVCIGITIFAFQTKIDFTVYAGVMFVAVLVLMVMGLILMFVKIPILHVIYAGVGALIFCVYLIIDTQMIVGGTHKNQISPEEYIFGAISLYTDIIQIFLYVLQILNYASSD